MQSFRILAQTGHEIYTFKVFNCSLQRHLWVHWVHIKVLLFLPRRGICVQSFMTPAQTGPEICAFKGLVPRSVSIGVYSDDITLYMPIATDLIEKLEHAYLRPCLRYSHDTLHTYASPREEQMDLNVDPMDP